MSDEYSVGSFIVAVNNLLTILINLASFARSSCGKKIISGTFLSGNDLFSLSLYAIMAHKQKEEEK